MREEKKNKGMLTSSEINQIDQEVLCLVLLGAFIGVTIVLTVIAWIEWWMKNQWPPR